MPEELGSDDPASPGSEVPTEPVPPTQSELETALLEFATEFILFTDDRGGLVSGVGAALATIGSAGPDAGGRSGRHIAEQLHPDDLPAVLALIERARSDPDFEEKIDARARGGDGEWRRFRSTVIGLSDHPVLGTGAIVRTMVVDDNDSGDTEDSFVSLAEELGIGVLSADRRGWVVYSNSAAQELFSLERDSLTGHGWIGAVVAQDLGEVQATLAQVIARGRSEQVVFRLRRERQVRWVRLRAVPLAPLEHPSGWVASVEDVTDLRRSEVRLSHDATHDSLTGLPNRILIEDRLQQVLAREVEEGEQVAVLYCDLDGFKIINDDLGHQVGDLVLMEVARRILQVVRPADTVGRLGGDEFVVVADRLNERQAGDLAARIETSISEPFLFDTQPMSPIVIGVSIGLDLAAPGTRSAGELLAAADVAMYERKRERREL